MTMKRLTICLDAGLANALRLVAKERGVSVSELARVGLRDVVLAHYTSDFSERKAALKAAIKE